MIIPGVEMHGSDGDNVLSEPLGPGTLEARSIVPDAHRSLSNSHMGMGERQIFP